MQPPNRETWDDISFSEKRKTFEAWAFFLLLGVLVFRKSVGYRLVHPLWLSAMSMAMLALAALAQTTPGSDMLIIHAIAVIVLGLSHRLRRNREKHHGGGTHSYFMGISPLERFMPRWLKNQNRVNRFVDPLFFILLGVASFSVAPAWAAYLVVAGLSLRLMESMTHQREQNERWDLNDAFFQSRIQSAAIESLSAQAAWQSHAAQGGLPTGLASDVLSNMERQNNRKQSGFRDAPSSFSFFRKNNKKQNN